jgi:hypothetical protein
MRLTGLAGLRGRHHLPEPLRVLRGGGQGESEERAKDDGQVLEVHGVEGWTAECRIHSREYPPPRLFV